MIREIVDKIEKRGAAVAADKARIAISSVFGWAIETGAVKSLEDNPARAIAMRSTNEPRRRPWTNEELKSVWNALDGKTRTSTALIVRLVAVTACRRAEVTGAKISEFDILNARWTIPGKSRGKKGLLIRGRTKSQNEKVVPLSPFALELVERAIKLASDRKKVSPTKGEDYLFPSFGICKTAHVDPHSITRAIARIAKALIIHDLHLHDLRTTCRTWMRGVGISSDVRDAVLGHKGETVGERVYEGADLNFIEQRVRPAMEIWSNHLISVVAV